MLFLSRFPWAPKAQSPLPRDGTFPMGCREGVRWEGAAGKGDFRQGPPMIGPNGAERGARSVGGAADGAKGETAAGRMIAPPARWSPCGRPAG